MRSPKVAKAVPGIARPVSRPPRTQRLARTPPWPSLPGTAGTFRWFRVASWGPIDVALLVRPIDTPV